MLQDSTGLVIMLVGVHVDDLIIMGVTSAVLWFKQAMIRNFKMEDLGWPTRCLGVDIIFHNNGSIQLTQATYIKKLLQKFNMVECKTMPTPMCVNASFTKEDEEDNLDFPYRELVASLLYAAIATMPDLAYTVKELSRFLTRPGKKMKETAKRALRYCARHANRGLLYSSHKRPGAISKLGCCDADWAGQATDRKSTGGMVLLFNGCALMWWCRTIRVVALSSQDAEFMTLSDTSREVIFLQNLLYSIGYMTKDEPMTILGDNRGSIAVANTPGDHQKSKHLEVRYFFIRQKIEDGRIQVKWISTKNQLADVLTKALPEAQHETLTLIITGHAPLPDEIVKAVLR